MFINQCAYISRKQLIHLFVCLYYFRMQSFIGKMKFGVSKILPNSLSKWLSPKVDTNNRRRPYSEIESDEDASPSIPSQLLSQANSPNSQTATQSSIAPPSKRQKIFTVSLLMQSFPSLKTSFQSMIFIVIFFKIPVAFK